jgi:hypothetical protein
MLDRKPPHATAVSSAMFLGSVCGVVLALTAHGWLSYLGIALVLGSAVIGLVVYWPRRTR